MERLRIHGNAVKPAHEIKPDDVIELRSGNIPRTVQVRAPCRRPVAATELGRTLEHHYVVNAADS